MPKIPKSRDDFFLRNRATIAVITGGTQGLGLAIAKRLAMEGAGALSLVVEMWRREKKLLGVSPIGTDCLFVKADISTIDDCHRLIDTADGYSR
jgi:NAD(P)-dependent dehydrogenase (short-subunit alcohol dehydrogenase family)